ncbi:hypothetical protein ACFPRL_35995 [Pseudoclavibacter helvolus]
MLVRSAGFLRSPLVAPEARRSLHSDVRTCRGSLRRGLRSLGRGSVGSFSFATGAARGEYLWQRGSGLGRASKPGRLELPFALASCSSSQWHGVRLHVACLLQVVCPLVGIRDYGNRNITIVTEK